MNVTGVPPSPRGRLRHGELNNALGSQNNAGSVSETMNVPVGDVNSSGRVDGNDVSAVQSQTRCTVNSANFQYDVNVTGGIHGNDVSMTQSQTRHSLP